MTVTMIVSAKDAGTIFLMSWTRIMDTIPKVTGIAQCVKKSVTMTLNVGL